MMEKRQRKTNLKLIKTFLNMGQNSLHWILPIYHFTNYKLVFISHLFILNIFKTPQLF